MGITLLNFHDVVEAGANDNTTFQKCKSDDYPIFSYTSGTTGDSKGVKLTHFGLLASANSISHKLHLNHEDSVISYLPYPHSFE